MSDNSSTPTVLDFLRQFHQRAIKENFPPSVRAMYAYLLGEYNAAQRPKKFSTTHPQIQAKSGIKKSTAHSSLSFLAERHIIKITNNVARTLIYVELLPNSVWITPGQQQDAKSAGDINTRTHTNIKKIEKEKDAHDNSHLEAVIGAKRKLSKSFDEVLADIQRRRNSGNM